MTDPPTPQKRSLTVRSVHAGHDLELFLVTAVATILVVRAALAATGWPQLGGGKIHFAHLLWGGLGMVTAIVLLLAMQGRLWKLVATLAAGFGFGLFIDELGKFVTSDNDYFFQPAVAFIYLVFVILFLVARAITHGTYLSPQAALVNALDSAKEAVIRDMDDRERAEALLLLSQCDQHDPVVGDLARMIETMGSTAKGPPRFYERTKASLQRLYEALVRRRWFKGLLAAYVGLIALSGLIQAVLLFLIEAVAQPGGPQLDFWQYGQMISAMASTILVFVGLVRWRSSRVAAYRWFERALLVSLFVGEFFAFYQSQSSQFFSVVLVLLTYAALGVMIRREEAQQAGLDSAVGVSS